MCAQDQSKPEQLSPSVLPLPSSKRRAISVPAPAPAHPVEGFCLVSEFFGSCLVGTWLLTRSLVRSFGRHPPLRHCLKQRPPARVDTSRTSSYLLSSKDFFTIQENIVLCLSTSSFFSLPAHRQPSSSVAIVPAVPKEQLDPVSAS